MTAPRHAIGVLFLAVLLPGPPVLGAKKLEDDGRAVVRKVIDRDTVRLICIQAPQLPLGLPGFAAWPLAKVSKRALGTTVSGRAARNGHVGCRLDRHGCFLAHLLVTDRNGGDDLWVRGELVSLGMARVCTFPDNRRLAAAMLALEGRARAAQRGICAHPFYAVRVPRKTGSLIDTFQTVEGKVLDAARMRNRVFPNFGLDWCTYFIVALSSKTCRLFKNEAGDPGALAGRRVRVRGWIKRFNGPLVHTSYPEQVEVLLLL